MEGEVKFESTVGWMVGERRTDVTTESVREREVERVTPKRTIA